MMLTPNDIANKKFEKGMGGYKVNDVEAFMSQVSDTVIALLKEKAELENKLETLADKLQEYRQDEESLRTALLGAQKLGDGVIRESKTKAEIIMRDATIKAERMVENAQIQIEKERTNLAKMQAEVSSFKSRLLALYKQHLSLITALPDTDEKVAAAPVEDEDIKVAKPFPKAPVEEEIPPSRAEVTHINEVPRRNDEHEEYQDEYEDEPARPQRKQESRLVFMTNEEDDEYEDGDEEQEEKPAQPVSKYESRFGPLKFGAEYDLKRDDVSALGKKKR